MRVLFKTIIAALFVTTMAQPLIANKNGLGIRISGDFGVTYKYNLKSNTTIEGILGMPGNALELTGLYEKYYKIEGLKGLNWFVGGGAYIGINNSTAGVKGVLGLCYNFSDIPVDISVDWMPAIQVVSRLAGNINSLGLSVRYKF